MAATKAPPAPAGSAKEADAAISHRELLSPRGALLLGAYFLALLPLLCWALYRIIALIRIDPRSGRAILGDADTFLAVIVAGALGSYVHAVTSFATYRGNRELYSSWGWWYMLRPFVGVAMALLFYFAARGGVLAMSGGTGGVDAYAVLIVAALAGMFSKQASDKLADVFDTLFGSKTAGTRKDKLHVTALRVSAVKPPKTQEGSGLRSLTLVGENFVAGSAVTYAGQRRKSRFVDASHLKVALEPGDTAKAGLFPVVVTTPAPAAGSSEPVMFEVTPRVKEGGDPPPEKPAIPLEIEIKGPDGGGADPKAD